MYNFRSEPNFLLCKGRNPWFSQHKPEFERERERKMDTERKLKQAVIEKEKETAKAQETLTHIYKT